RLAVFLRQALGIAPPGAARSPWLPRHRVDRHRRVIFWDPALVPKSPGIGGGGGVGVTIRPVFVTLVVLACLAGADGRRARRPWPNRARRVPCPGRRLSHPQLDVERRRAHAVGTRARGEAARTGRNRHHGSQRGRRREGGPLVFATHRRTSGARWGGDHWGRS